MMTGDGGGVRVFEEKTVQLFSLWGSIQVHDVGVKIHVCVDVGEVSSVDAPIWR